MKYRNCSGVVAMARLFFALLLVFSFISCNVVRPLEAANSDGASASARLASLRGKKGVRLSLSNLTQFWNEKVFGRVFDDWNVDGPVSGKEGLQNFTRAVTIAAYLKLSLVDAIYLPVPINFIFVGFDGEGNEGFKFGEEELHWFTNTDHVLEHSRVPQLGEELTPFYRMKGCGERQHHLPLISYTHYNYSVHGIELNSKTTAVFERAINLLSRKDDSLDTGSESPLWQVDIGGMSHIFQSLVIYLQIEKAYNIFILNPKREPGHGRYGYRYGLSASETKFLKENADKTAALLKSKDKLRDYLKDVDKIKNPLYERHPLTRVSWTNAEDDHTATWVDEINKALDALEAALLLKSEEELTIWTASQILNGDNVQLAAALRKGFSSQEESGLLPECLVDAWVGHERWSFLDLSAGPFTWGPTVGGDGIRSKYSLPSMDAIFNSLSLADMDIDNEAVQEDFEKLWHSRFSHFGDDEQHAVDFLLAEIDVYEIFADKHCKGRRIALAFCVEFQKRVANVRGELGNIYRETTPKGGSDGEILKHKLKAAELLKRLDEWNVFGLVNQRAEKFSVARDSFLAHLASVLSSSMKHVVTPSTADGAFHYYETVSFEVYFITQDKFKDDRLLPVDTHAVKAALSRLIVPMQKAIFGFHTLALSEDPALAMAFTSSKRASVVPTLLVNGSYKSADRVYLDSLVLQHHIKQLDFPTTGRKSTGRSIIGVPIFWFLRSSGEPLLVDKHFQAKALSDMVVVVQSTDHSWDSHLQCNGESIPWDLRQPSKAAIAAVAEHMAGLLPSHLSFSQAHENSFQDWLWSVGSHPFSSTSAGWHVSQFHNDAMARSYILTALDESIDIINSGVQLLSNERTQKALFFTFRDREQSLRYSFNRVINLWKQIAGLNEELRYGDALKLLTYLENSARSFYSNANETIGAMHPVYCTRQHKFQTRMNLLTGLSLLTIVIVFWSALRPKRRKPKIN